MSDEATRADKLVKPDQVGCLAQATRITPLSYTRNLDLGIPKHVTAAARAKGGPHGG